MVKPATFHTTMAMIDQKAGWKVASRLNFLSVRPRLVGGRAEQAGIDIEQP